MKRISYLGSLLMVGLAATMGQAQQHIFFDGGPFYSEVIFEETFMKPDRRLTVTRTISTGSAQLTARIFLRNGPGDLERVNIVLRK